MKRLERVFLQIMLLNPARDIKIGTSGYAYPGAPPKGWYGAFYPDKKRKGFDELNYYAQIFNTCEINTTFYRPPSPAITKSWAEKTPDDFSFAVKLWQKFTHPIKISRNKSEDKWEPASQSDFDEFRAGILPLAEAGKLGALLLQYPAGFHFSAENLEKIESTLKWFYDYPKVVELRHKSWSEKNPEIKALLLENRASGVLIDEPKFATSIRQPAEAIGEIFYFRAHGRNAKAWWNPKESWERYDYLYSSRGNRKTRGADQNRRKHCGSQEGISPSITTTRARTRRQTPSCCRRNWESGSKPCRRSPWSENSPTSSKALRAS